MKYKINTSIPANENCPRFSFCQINKCPLHPDYSKLVNESSDPAMLKKQKCVNKQRRLAIAKHYPELKNKGMTPREEEKMAIRKTDPKLLDILVCPLTKTPLEYDEKAQELISRQAGLAYPIRDGIPVMLVDEARQLDA